MRRHHPKNERVKRRYLTWLEDAKRLSPHSVDQAAAAIAAFEVSTNYKDFAAFHIEQARRFKRQLSETTNSDTGRPLAKATVHSRLMAVKGFFQWLARESGYRARLNYSDAEYFNPSANDTRIAMTRREAPSPELVQIHSVTDAMPAETVIEKRDRAVIAFTILTGSRDGAIASLSLRHVDLDQRVVHQDAREVHTKFRKSFPTWFFPVGGHAEAIVRDWINLLRTEMHFGSDDPLFPQTQVGLDSEGRFAPVGLQRTHWKNADAVRRIFRVSFTAAGLPAFHPHSFRKTLVRLGQELCETPEEFKAWSQNLGHDDVLTTFTSYGSVPAYRQQAIISSLGDAKRCRSPRSADIDELERLVRRMRT